MWRNIVLPRRPQMTIWRIRTACWIPKAEVTPPPPHTHTKYEILIAFPLQQWLHERARLLRYTYIAYIVDRWCNEFVTDVSVEDGCQQKSSGTDECVVSWCIVWWLSRPILCGSETRSLGVCWQQIIEITQFKVITISISNFTVR